MIDKATENPKLKLNDLITVSIGPIAHGGHFISRHNGQVVFVRHAITDEVAVVKITSIGSKIAFGDAIEIIEPSKDRVNAPCKYSSPELCGGCDFQHISMAAQLKFKKIVIEEQFERIANIKISPEVINAGIDSGLHWRTHLDFAISKNGKVGLYSFKTKEVIEIEECLIAVNPINKLNIFNSKWDGEERLSVFASSLNEVSIHRLDKNISGPSEINEVVEGNSYNISHGSFWQSHKNAPKILINKLMEFANFETGDRVCDLYGGVGLFTAPILKIIGETGEIHLIETNNRCIKDAKKIFEKKKNVIIHHGKVEQKLGKIKNIDAIVMDPPRTGATKQVINQIVEKKARSIIYISCDPSSLARDTKILLNSSYTLDKIIGLDLFPMTHHIECIASFTLEKKI
jgi:tRNA/tmRNA/rRNA uracil-C5-methylase (TrmA/RlmC/RlmD family)